MKRKINETWIRRSLFVLLLLLVFVLQSTDGLLPAVFGVRPLLLIPAVICIGMFEREVAGLLFGLFAGLLWDTLHLTHNYHAVALTILGFACGVLAHKLLRNNIMTVTLLNLICTTLYCGVHWLVHSGPTYVGVLYKTYLPTLVYTLLLGTALYYLVRFLSRRFVANTQEAPV